MKLDNVTQVKPEPTKDIEFCYHLKNRWPNHVRKNKKNSAIFESIVFDAIDHELELLEDEDMNWSIFTEYKSNIEKFNQNQQICLLKRLKKALILNNHSFDEEDYILEEALYYVVSNWVDWVKDHRNDYKKEWNNMKRLAKLVYSENFDESEDTENYFKDVIWWDLDFQMFQLKNSHIKEYKKILLEYI